MSIKKLRMVDVLILTLLMVILEVVWFFVSKSIVWLSYSIYLPISTVIILILCIRWKQYAVVSAAIIFILKLLLTFDFHWLNILCIASMTFCPMIALPFIKAGDKELHNEIGLTAIFGLFGYICSLLVVVPIQVFIIKENMFAYSIANGINLIFGISVLMIACKQENFLIDMDEFLNSEIEKRQKMGRR